MKGVSERISERTFEFAVRIVNLCKFLDEANGTFRTISRQLIRSGTSIGANVEESQAAQSKADFIHKLAIALKASKETQYWLKLLLATELVPPARLNNLLNESHEITKIIAAIIIKTKQNQTKEAN
jgi:four helix bundle protein